MHVIIGGGSNAMTCAYTTASGGENAIILNPTHRRWDMWGAGLIQTDRTNVFKNADKVSFRRGALLETVQRMAKVARPDITGTTDQIVLVTNTVVHTVFEGMMADFATPKTGKGVIVIVDNAPLQEIDQDPITNAIRRVRAGGVWYEGLNFHDATTGLDLARMAKCRTTHGRNSAAMENNAASGVRPVSSGGQTTARATKPGTGRRLKNVNPRSSKKPGDADHKLMAFNQRLIVTNTENRIKFADLVVPDYDPSNYDKDYQIAKDQKLGKVPGTISQKPLEPDTITNPQYDWNNGGLGKIGTNWPGQFLDWYAMTPYKRIEYLGDYTAHKAGLLKAICTEQRWKDLPPLIVKEKDANGNDINVPYQISTETQKWGLCPGVFVDPPCARDTDVALGTIGVNGSSLYICVKAGKTAATGGPTGKGTSILDGAAGTGDTPELGARWRFLRYYVAGMSPFMYEREGIRLVGRRDKQHRDVTAPERNVAEPVFAYGYPQQDGHWADVIAAENGNIWFEGGGALEGGLDPVGALMEWGCMLPPYAECPNITVSRGTAGSRAGWMEYRLEWCFMLGGDVSGRAAARSARRTAAEKKTIYVGDLDYQNDIYPEVLAGGHLLSVPGI